MASSRCRIRAPGICASAQAVARPIASTIRRTQPCLASRNPPAIPSYTGLMSIVRNIAGIAKGMSITFREMLAADAGGELP